MKKETKRRIKYYEEILPGLKERVAAAGLMLVIAMIATVTATYAWVTLSRAPAVSGVNTTVTSNGNLEIALSPADGSQPEEFDVDESAIKSTDIVKSNLQWGNLINLSDPSYGIHNLILRPAELNTASLIYSPLWGAVYGADGRIVTKDSDYTFAKWSTLGNEFLASSDYGVRAIASYTLGTTEGANVVYNEKLAQVNAAHSEVNDAYQKVAKLIPSMSSILSTYVQGQVPESMGGGAQDPFTSAQMQSMLNMYNALYDTMKEHEEALVTLANFQRYVNSINNNVAYEEITWDELEAGKVNYNAESADAGSKDGVIVLTGLTRFISDYNTIKKDKGYLENYYNGASNGTKTIYWDKGGESGYQIQDMVSRLVDYSNMSVVIEGVETTFAQITGDVTGYAFKLLGMDKEHTNAYIKGGIVKNFEQMAIDQTYRLQGQTNNAVVTVKVTATLGISMTITIYGDCYTKAVGTSYYMDDYTTTVGNPLAGKQVVAEDTYGMAVDFWLRTNAESTYLTLEGALVTEEDPVSGERTILSYDGVNRVWGSTNATVMTSNSTTQGGGSCYIYYADTPEDMNRSLSLLKSMKVAFVDAEGNMVAGARMDTENYHALNGRITVPLVIEENTGVDFTYENEQGQEVTARALMHMVNDAARRLTAIIYLDGTRLTNNDVLAAADIQGQLNIQFGSSDALDTIGDDKLLVAERVVTATVDKTSMDFDNAISEADLTAKVTVKIDGTTANNVTAFFTRAINATQGQRQDTMTFAKQEGGDWTASYTFTSPGTYYLRQVRLDGVDYFIEDAPKVEVTGFAVESVDWGESSNEVVVYTANSTYSENIFVKFASDDPSNMPSKVQALFLQNDGSTVNVDLKYDSSEATWEGTGIFTRSGIYTLQYLLLDGNYVDVGTSAKTLTLSLGMKTQVYNNGNSLQDEYEANGTYSKKVGVKIFDNENNEITGLTGAKLRYSLGGSITNTVDTDLTWDDAEGWYKGTLPLTKPGRYSYLEVISEDATGSLTNVIDAPVFHIISPEPPVYDETSVSTYHDEVQFAPLSNDAYIGPFRIENSGGVSISAEVQNSITGKTYTIVNSNVEGANGTIHQEDETWYINLPVYTDDLNSDGEPLENAVYTQEGTWTVKSISVWDCYDEDSNFRQESNPIVWTSEDYNFEPLSTTVSCSVNVTMTAGTTSLGSSSAAFMANNYVKDIGLYVEMKDDAGRIIPATSDRTMTLTVAYANNTDDDDISTYGYEVTGAGRDYRINLTQDNASGKWVVAEGSNHNWQYVGEYTVVGLSVSMEDVTTTYTSGSGIGIPKMYTVTSAAPTAENLSIKNISQGDKVFGKDASGNVTGLFLSSYNPNITVELSLTYKDENNQTKEAVNARVEGTAVNLNLTYQDGNTAPNGGYSWSTSNDYTNITMPMTNTNKETMIYSSGVSILHAGEYAITGTLSVGGTSRTFGGIDNIEVYSKAPQLTVDSYTQRTGYVMQSGEFYNNGTHSYGFDKQKTSSVLSQVTGAVKKQNTYENNTCTVYIPLCDATEDDDGTIYYTVMYNDDSEHTTTPGYDPCPKVTLKISDINTGYGDITVTIPGSNDTSLTWAISSGNTISDAVSVGEVSGSYQYSRGSCNSATHYYTTKNVFGSGTVNRIDVPYGGCTYSVTLKNPLTINNPY